MYRSKCDLSLTIDYSHQCTPNGVESINLVELD